MSHYKLSTSVVCTTDNRSEYHLVTHNRRHEKASNMTVGDLGRPWMTLNVNKQDLDLKILCDVACSAGLTTFE